MKDKIKQLLKGFYLNIKMFTGFFGILYSIIFFFYYFIRINKISAFVFILPFALGIYLIANVKEKIVNESSAI